MKLETFELVLLWRPEHATDYDEARLARIQQQHLAFYRRMRDEGHVVTNGPVLDQRDETFRGLAFFRTGSLELARQLATTDPAVVAGRLEIEVMTWWCPAGTMISEGQLIEIGD